MLANNATTIEGVGADVGVDLVGGLLPHPGRVVLVAEPGQPRAAVRGHPAHDLRGREVPRLSADLPDAAVRLAPVFEGVLDLLPGELPDSFVQPVARPGVQVDRFKNGPPDVVLL